MPTNVEIKARVSDEDVGRILCVLGEKGAKEPTAVITQDDTFFRANTVGRHLKLRNENPNGADGPGRLIYYEREATTLARPSAFTIVEVSSVYDTSKMLERSIGISGRVYKERRLFMLGRTRVHIDRINGLGMYVELEVQMDPGEPIEHGVAEADAIMQAFQIPNGNRESRTYMQILRGEQH